MRATQWLRSCGSLNSFDRWLNLPLLLSRERPVPLIEGVLDRRGTFQFIDMDGAKRTEALLPANRIVQRRAQPSSLDVIVPLAGHLVSQGEKLLIFRNMRGSAQGRAKYLAKELGLRPAATVLMPCPSNDLTSTSQDLRERLAGGTAFHNINLLRAEREAVERGYGNIIGIADAARVHLRSAHQILSTLLPEQPEFLSGLDKILQRLEFGLPSAALPLASSRCA